MELWRKLAHLTVFVTSIALFGLKLWWLRLFHSTQNNAEDDSIQYERTNCSTMLRICNLNVIRGSKLFTLPGGGPGLYRSHVSDSIQNSSLSIKLVKSLSKRNISRLTHNMDQMLIRCEIDSKPCWAQAFNFVSDRNDNVACYELNLNISSEASSNIRLVLDPQEYDYLLPNDGLIGFRLALIAKPSIKQTEDKQTRSMDRDELIVGSRLHNLVDVKVSFAHLIQRYAHLQLANSTVFHLLGELAHELYAGYTGTSQVSQLLTRAKHAAVSVDGCHQLPSQNLDITRWSNRQVSVPQWHSRSQWLGGREVSELFLVEQLTAGTIDLTSTVKKIRRALKETLRLRVKLLTSSKFKSTANNQSHCSTWLSSILDQINSLSGTALAHFETVRLGLARLIRHNQSLRRDLMQFDDSKYTDLTLIEKYVHVTIRVFEDDTPVNLASVDRKYALLEAISSAIFNVLTFLVSSSLLIEYFCQYKYKKKMYEFHHHSLVMNEPVADRCQDDQLELCNECENWTRQGVEMYKSQFSPTSLLTVDSTVEYNRTHECSLNHTYQYHPNKSFWSNEDELDCVARDSSNCHVVIDKSSIPYQHCDCFSRSIVT